MRSPFYIVLLKRILMKTMLRKYYRLCFKSFFNPLSANRAKWSHTLKQFVTRAKWSNMLKQFVTRAKWTNTLKQFVGKMVKHAQTIRGKSLFEIALLSPRRSQKFASVSLPTTSQVLLASSLA